MKLAAMMFALCLAPAAWAQDENEVEKLKKENAELKAAIDGLRRMISPPARLIDAKVTAVSTEIGLVIISAGRDAGMVEGTECTILRGAAFIAKIVIDKVDVKWSSGRILLKKDDPRISDDVSTGVLVAAPAQAPKVDKDNLREIRKELDEVRRQIRELTDRLAPSWNSGTAVEPLSDEWKGHFGVAGGLIIRKIREGSTAEKAGLKPFDVVPDLTEEQLLDALTKGAPIKVIRGGKRLDAVQEKTSR